ncbi:hypothetical protein FEM48_Zijuj10G0168800 [Ziziphus jujuba var. spinosa]|uniref:Serpin domain-containing protein n=1 Tax=Ziziphus jujuba var. spinosa TaxID=714518 RepID=A0A978UPK6_ZIZJJ|nr:hypothetical protein FEM48_Zijuj10G0168800 [Ziziphus jujuba var. spinosa]
MEHSPQSNDTTLFNRDFSLRLTNQILEKEASKGSNFVASPLSLHVMLSLIAAGSKGQTLQQLLHFLGSTSVGDLNLLSLRIINLASPAENLAAGGPLLSFVNGAWLDQRFSLKSSFEEIARSSYRAELKSAEEVVKEVNSWAEAATKGLIKDLLPAGSLDSDTALVLANALYFKGAWDQQFDTSSTQLREFHLLNGQTTVQVPFMTTGRNTRHLYRSFDGYKVLQIPYQTSQDHSRKFSMYFFLPVEKDGLHNLIKKNIKLNPGFLNQQFNLRLEDDLSDFWIPKFKFSFQLEASKSMKEMGLTLPFQAGELTEMVDSPNGNRLFVSDIFHKSHIEVNEEGTEAAAVTATTFVNCCLGIPTPRFVADHPFLFMIREETHGVVFFVGAVLNPLLEA